MDHALLDHVAAVLGRHIKAGDRLTVGLSGGLDSVVLLHLFHRLRNRFAFHLAAHHVNHQISSHAASWATFCESLCIELAVPFTQTLVDVPRQTDVGLEASARLQRYRAFRELDSDFMVLAHHQDDQAETLLFRLLRGAGVKGLGAMGEASVLPTDEESGATLPLRLLRPLLHVPRASLMAFARSEGCTWIDDESNADARYTRNYIRNELMPRIEARFPAYRSVLDRCAAQFAEAEQLLDTLAAMDAKGAIESGRMNVSALSILDEPRAKNLLRHFLAQHHLKMPSHDRLQEILRQILTSRDDAMACVAHDGIELRRFRDWLYVVPQLLLPPPDWRLQWEGQREWRIGELNGVMTFQETVGSGIKMSLLTQSHVYVQLRQGGEKLRLGEQRPRRTLRNLLPAADIPPWDRERLPLLYIGNELAFVPGVGIDASFQVQCDEPGMIVTWLPYTRAR